MQPPFSSLFQEHYWSQSGGLAEKTHVFLEGNDLPRRFVGAAAFTVAELGFGTGLNFALAAALWSRCAGLGGKLTYIGYELHPFSPAELKDIQKHFPLFPGKEEMLGAYFPRKGWNIWEGETVSLHLYVGDATDGLTMQKAQVDAWFLDGFSPAVNPALWSPSVLAEVGRLTVPQGTVSTYSVAQAVREGLKAVGFTVEKAAGHPPKRHMLRAIKSII